MDRKINCIQENKYIYYKHHRFIKYISQKKIYNKIQKLNQEINTYYLNKEPIVLGVLNGAIFFMVDILRGANYKCEIDFINVKSYVGMQQKKIFINQCSNISYKNRDVLIVEDIIDSGKTIKEILNFLYKKEVNEIKIVSLLKKNKLKTNFFIDWCGFEINNKYVIGYGLDINNLFRNLKDIYIQDEKKK